MSNDLPIAADSAMNPQKKFLNAIVAALDNKLPGSKVTIQNGSVKVVGKTSDAVIVAEMRMIGSVAEERKSVAPRKKRGDRSIVEDAKKLSADGKTQTEIADILGRSQAAISGYLKS